MDHLREIEVVAAVVAVGDIGEVGGRDSLKFLASTILTLQ